ncbi:hypothetical protein [Streptomyces sp. NBC_00878]|uniref:hypothetical protein n=1 Tax=Streptomyces sp. NBC_00878 TaxID=2975854 RepID=UPI002259B35F|nr:hypothetical protein [Streptomyces sp. NBC_00878]MCX4911220.1 hypothetical protein [Streptomyces sp. NBC_00878]
MTNSAIRSSATVRAPRRFIMAAICAVAVSALATGCSSDSAAKDKSSGKGDGVASVSDPSGKGKEKGTSSGSGAAGKDAPQIRLDTTEPEKLAMYQPYLSCLKSNGVPVEKAGIGGPNANGKFSGDPSQLWYPSADVSDYPKAVQACTGKEPLYPPELDPKKNPHFMDDFRKQIECMDGRGLKVDPLPDGSGWNYGEGGSSLSTAETTRIEHECQMEAFGGQD